MPIISRFFGIIITIYWRDHEPAHFHAKYGDTESTIEILTGNVKGNLSSRTLSIVQEWRILHLNELIENWDLAKQRKPLKNINPLE